MPADVAVRDLRELPTTWKKADGGPGRKMLAEALFSRIDVLGAREAIPDRIDVTVGNGRGERISTDTNDLPISMRLAEPPTPLEQARSA